VVHVQGAATQTNASTSGANQLGTLQRAARPSQNVFTIVHTFGGTYADLGIFTDGKIFLIDPAGPAAKDYSFVSLEGITYQR